MCTNASESKQTEKIGITVMKQNKKGDSIGDRGKKPLAADLPTMSEIYHRIPVQTILYRSPVPGPDPISVHGSDETLDAERMRSVGRTKP